MLEEPILVDTSAIVALFNEKEPSHASCVEQARTLPLGKSFTCWPVITEAVYLLRHHPSSRDQLLQAVANNEFALLMLGRGDLAGIREVFTQYHDQEVDLADAALVHLANRESIGVIFTLDRRHFGMYRPHNGGAFRLLPE